MLKALWLLTGALWKLLFFVTGTLWKLLFWVTGALQTLLFWVTGALRLPGYLFWVKYPEHSSYFILGYQSTLVTFILGKVTRVFQSP